MKPRTSLQRGRWHQRIATSALGALISLTAHGQATVDPDTQPFMTLAPYVLKSSNVEPRVGNPDGGTRAYRPWFENGAWTGDLIEYEILASGVRVVRDDIGNYPRDGADWRGTSSLWTARYSFPDFVPYNPNDTTWQCVEEDAEYWKARNIFTVKSGARVSFLWTELSPGQRTALDQNTALDTDVESDPYASSILNYVRGDRSLERCKEDGQFRWRFSLLGSIVNSRPAYVPAGTGQGVVVVGANDGMLHGFNAADGKEVFAYVPSMILDRVGLLRVPGTRPGYLVDGELRHREIVVATDTHHILAGGLGAGGKGLFVLNVSDPQFPDVIAEVAGANPGHIGGTWDDRLGYIHGRPTIARLPDGVPGNSKWYVVSGNGYASSDGRAWLVLIPLEGAPTPIFIKADDTASNGLSPPSLVDVTGNGIADYAYAGDSQGNLWRFDLSANSVQKVFAAGPNKPIVVEPDIARHPVTEDGFMIFFGTGSLLSGADVTVESQQSVFGLWDRPLNAAHQEWLPINTNRLVTQELKSANVTWSIPDGSCGAGPDTTALSTVRFVHDQQPLSWTIAQPHLGWQVHLPRDGERLIGHPQVRAERIQFITTNPFDMANPPDPDDYPGNQPAYEAQLAQSGSWMLQLDLATGGNALRPRALFDLNKDCTLSVADGAPAGAIAFDGTAIPTALFPVGANLGPFNIAQPAFARVRFDSSVGSVVDGVYINALFLPPQDPPGNVMQGPLDVTTDSPSGPFHKPLPEPVKSTFKARLFPQASGPTKAYLGSDGLGHRVDGHSMGYNKHHGVDYVDLFHLEPRRGQHRLDVGVMYDDGTTYKPIVLDADSQTGLRASQRELNRVGEVGISENQRFIIMLTNADLSRGNRLRIGDRTWPVYEYQTMMMQHLRKEPDQMMTDLIANNLVFTLRGDFNPICPLAQGPDPEDCSNRLRITTTERVGSLDATMGTLPGCVNNTDRYEGDIEGGVARPYTTRKHRLQSGNDLPLPFLDANGNLISPYTPETLYADAKYDPLNKKRLDNPHATPYPLASGGPWELGYRWRNGALTLQLLAVDGTTAAFQLQDKAHWPEPNPDAKIQGNSNRAVEGIDISWGGAYAKAFSVVNGEVVPLNNPPSPPGRFVGNSGLLYELSMFWHWGDMVRYVSQGGGSPVVPICYGTREYVPSLARETDTFNPADYRDLTAELEADDDLQDEYAYLVALVAAGTADAAAVLRLQQIISGSDNIRDYHRLRHYVPNNPKLEDRLLRIDRADWSINVTVDGTPVDVVDVERDLLPSLGPNYQPGRRSWIDLIPE